MHTMEYNLELVKYIMPHVITQINLKDKNLKRKLLRTFSKIKGDTNKLLDEFKCSTTN